MKISINTLQFYKDMYQWSGDILPNGIKDLTEKIGAQLGGIEATLNFGDRYTGAIIVRIVSCQKHPNADKLNICMIDDGGKVEGLERDTNSLVQVVCGAPNVHSDMLVVWLPPGSTVPDSYGKEPFVLGARELRGVVSNGMLASARELAISDSHDGILEIIRDSDESMEPGTTFADAYHLNGDVVIDIENKMFTHRPDCFGYIGVAREIAGIQGMSFKSPEWYRTDIAFPNIEANALPLEFRNELPQQVERFVMVAMSDVVVKASPLWLQIELAKVGSRSINNIVDYTNYYMLLTGQPLHAYDYDKVKALDGGDKATIVVRKPKPGEKIKLLNGKEIEPRAEAIMIATETTLIGVGGVMGGADTEVDDNTKNIILEVANFDMYSIRRTSMAHGLFTDAVTRFNKGQSPLQNKAVIAKIVDEIRTLASGKVASNLIDDNRLPSDVIERNSLHPPVVVTADFINARLGLALSAEEINRLLTNVEFEVITQEDNLTVKAPFWRTDIEIAEDVVEEVGRLYGYDHLPLVLPKRSITPTQKDETMMLKASIRTVLSRAGANELLTYSFAHGKLLQNAGQDPEQAFKLSNALSPDLQYYRLSITPSLLDKVHANIKTGHESFALFELGKAHIKVGKAALDEEGLPAEFNRIALVFAANPKAAQLLDGAPYYQARHTLNHLLDSLQVSGKVSLIPFDAAAYPGHAVTEQMITPFEPSRTALLHDGEQVVGVVGEYKTAVRKAFKLPEYCAGFEIFHRFLLQPRETDYVPLSKYPRVEQDICLKVATEVTYQELLESVASEVSRITPDDTYSTISPVDIYQRPNDTNHKQITFRLSITSYDKTLRDSEVSSLLDQVVAAASSQCNAERV